MVVKLTNLAPQNPWWRKEDWETDDRDLKGIDLLLARREMALKKGGITILRGIRRSGKTVYLKMMVKKLVESGIARQNIVYISCDRYSFKEIENIVNEMSIRRGKIILLLDEITYLPDWYLLLKGLRETKDIGIIATGSDPMQIKAKAERLPGRGIEGNEYYFNPLSFGEFVRALLKIGEKIKLDPIKDALKDIRDIPDIKFSPFKPTVDEIFQFYEPLERLFFSYMLTGGFPHTILEYVKTGEVSDESYETLIRLILGTLSKGGRSENTGKEVFQQLLQGMGGRTDYLTIAQNIGVHHTTVKDHIDILDGARVVYTLQCWDIAKRRHSPRKQKKFVLQSPIIATALHRYLTGGTWDDVIDFVDRNMESLVEATVISHIIWAEERPLMKEQHSFAGFYYNRNECDCVLQREGGFQGYEIKFGKVERANYPFPVIYITKDTMDTDMVPASVFLFGLEKSRWGI